VVRKVAYVAERFLRPLIRRSSRETGAPSRVALLDVPASRSTLRKWLRRLPHPFPPPDRAAGYRYALSILQAEFSLPRCSISR
jgi:hypothetical protein